MVKIGPSEWPEDLIEQVDAICVDNAQTQPDIRWSRIVVLRQLIREALRVRKLTNKIATNLPKDG